MVTAMDDAVGLVVEALKETNLIDNTIIVFTADVRNSKKCLIRRFYVKIKAYL